MLKHVIKPALLALPLTFSCGREPSKESFQAQQKTEEKAKLEQQDDLSINILNEGIVRKLLDDETLEFHWENGSAPIFDGQKRYTLKSHELFANGINKIEHAFKNLEFLKDIDWKVLASEIRIYFFKKEKITEKDYFLATKLEMVPVLKQKKVSYIREENMLTKWIISLEHALAKKTQ